MVEKVCCKISGIRHRKTCYLCPAISREMKVVATKTVDFSEQLLTVLNNGATSLMLSVGHRTGLFDLMSELPPSDSVAIASAAKLNERYVREWLNAMTVSGIVEFDESRRTYHLPREHAKFLTRKNPSENLAVFAQYISLMGAVEDKIVNCFSHGGGVPYQAFERFHEVMAEDSGQSLVPIVDTMVIDLVPGLRAQLERGAMVLDIGCGRGLALAKLAARFPKSNFFGYDFSTEAIAFANKNSQALKLANLSFETKDVAKLSDTNEFDVITAFDAIHDQAQPFVVLKNIFHALKPGGTFIMLDIDAATEVSENMQHPIGPFLYTISCMHCMTVSLAAGGEGLGTVWGHAKAKEYLSAAGFSNIRIEKFEHDIQNCIYIASKPR